MNVTELKDVVKMRNEFKEKDQETFDWLINVSRSGLYSRLLILMSLTCASKHTDWTLMQIAEFIKKNENTIQSMIFRMNL